MGNTIQIGNFNYYYCCEGGDMDPETKAKLNQGIKDGSITKQMIFDAFKSQNDLGKTD